MQLVNTYAEKKPNPCPDCGRTYTVGESIAVVIPERSAPVWEGCVDCWVVRTSPAMCRTFVKED